MDISEFSEENSLKIRLNGVIIHRGTPYSGHYFFMGRNND